MEKTNVMRLLGQKKIEFTPHFYDPGETEGTKVALLLGQNEAKVFKTLVTEAPTREHFVFVIPVAESLDLKKAAKCAGVKSIAMIKQKELLPLTGYIHGGCSPVGMKKQFRTFFHETAASFDTICVSAGKVGCQVEVAPDELISLVRGELADLVDTEHPKE